ncbi:type II toxin-antitoxin system RelE/ParE family toxin [Dyadobacter sp. CY323]|uniref:type II toxin-antitoxin system RelE/ParE family toxin n=1 Tax=Dyadobacter sp. CY323 TaxID=2907302 RepID=UPI001F2E4E71|nr:type II toxin-antitoxin system RelE/ParE family toxin [Dyadobacter sp. CY323]MCE6988682.1 type II toxin-antitoxin system RelE/ParE family toxin [Dyadobacter sp. CY323]
MALDIIWSPRALDNFRDVIIYLDENWTEQVKRDFVKRTEKILDLIAEHPHMFRQVSETTSVREAVITKHNLLIYKIQKNQILVLAVFDTRQHPKRKSI